MNKQEYNVRMGYEAVSNLLIGAKLYVGAIFSYHY